MFNSKFISGICRYSKRRRVTSVRLRRSLRCELLENRRVFAITAMDVGGVLTVAEDVVTPDAADVVEIKRSINDLDNEVEVFDNGISIGVFGGLTSISVNTKNGNNSVRVFNDVVLNSTLTGGTGEDVLIGGAGADRMFGNGSNDVLVGGSGDDRVLQGGPGNDVIIGGAGLDKPDGGTGSDLLIGSTTMHDTSTSSLRDTVLAVWKTSDPFATRVTNIQAPGILELNTDVTPDGGKDELFGRTEDDLFYQFYGDVMGDVGGTDVVLNSTAPLPLDRLESLNVLGVQTLFIGGSIAADDLDIVSVPGGVEVFSFAVSQGSFLGIQTLDIDAKAGNDSVTVATALTIPAIIRGGLGDDTLSGGGGNDTLQGASGNDFLYGFGGNDFLSSGSGDDYASGGDGSDTILGFHGSDILDGGSGADTLNGDDGNDLLLGGHGIDNVDGLQGNDIVIGARTLLTPAELRTVLSTWNSAANIDAAIALLTDANNANGELNIDDGATPLVFDGEVINDDLSADVIAGNAGADWFFEFTSDPDTLTGFGVDDRLATSTAPYAPSLQSASISGSVLTITAGSAADEIEIDYLIGTDEISVNVGGASPDAFTITFPAAGLTDVSIGLGAGNDLLDVDLTGLAGVLVTVKGNIGNDTITVLSPGGSDVDGGGGDDVITGSIFADKLRGGTNNDQIDGGAGGADQLIGDAGNDTLILAGSSSVTALGGDGNDIINASAATGSTNLQGGNNDDSITGGSGTNFIRGDAGVDTINNGTGNSVVLGGTGDDLLTSGGGFSIFVGQGGADTITANAVAGSTAVITGDTNLGTNITSWLTRLTSWSGAGTLASRAAALDAALDATTDSVIDTVSVNDGAGDDYVVGGAIDLVFSDGTDLYGDETVV
jgi:Ca2+-binding RTX toxin-like protein